MSAEMISVLLITDNLASHWLKRLKSAVIGCVNLKTVPSEQAFDHMQVILYDTIIIDEAVLINDDHLIRRILQDWPACKIVIISNAPDWKRARKAFHAGAKDYISSSTTKEDFITFLQEI